jgi:DNA-binding ferritin-like protein
VNPLAWKKVGAYPFAPVAPTAEDASHSIWQDPSSYDPYTQGPPYLPERKGNRTASVQEVVAGVLEVTIAAPEAVLPAILTLLRSLAMVHQSHHWLTYGGVFYADHLLFDRLYNDVVGEIDQVAERAVGQGSPLSMIHPGAQAKQVARVVETLCGDGETFGEGENPDSFIATSLKAERWFLDCVRQMVASLEQVDRLSRGTDNLLAGIEDKHEEHVYLLLQRGKPAPKTAADLWKRR